MGGQTCVMSIKVDLNLLINNTKYESIITEIQCYLSLTKETILIPDMSMPPAESEPSEDRGRRWTVGAPQPQTADAVPLGVRGLELRNLSISFS